MSSIEPFTKGRFAWIELATSDVDRAMAYYGELYNWKKESEENVGAMGKYIPFKRSNGGEHFGGIMGLPPGQKMSYWSNYITVSADLDAEAKRTTTFGGTICMGPMDIPGAGRFAVIQDPTGGIFSLWKSARPNTQPEKQNPDLGEPCWYELMSTDLNKAKSFYGSVFGWSFEKGPMQTEEEYWIAKRGEIPTCGLMTLPEQAKKMGAPSHWASYILVSDINDTNKRAESLGGTCVVPTQEVPNYGYFSIYRDPTGAMIGNFQRK